MASGIGTVVAAHCRKGIFILRAQAQERVFQQRTLFRLAKPDDGAGKNSRANTVPIQIHDASGVGDIKRFWTLIAGGHARERITQEPGKRRNLKWLCIGVPAHDDLNRHDTGKHEAHGNYTQSEPRLLRGRALGFVGTDDAY